MPYIYAKNAAWDTCVRAITTARVARLNGRLAPKPCEKCGVAHPRINAHHEDYLRPLDVTWLCPKCHRRRHASIQRGVTLAEFLSPEWVWVPKNPPKQTAAA